MILILSGNRRQKGTHKVVHAWGKLKVGQTLEIGLRPNTARICQTSLARGPVSNSAGWVWLNGVVSVWKWVWGRFRERGAVENSIINPQACKQMTRQRHRYRDNAQPHKKRASIKSLNTHQRWAMNSGVDYNIGVGQGTRRLPVVHR